jgi:L-threonylcarbamoyladenylate synthase
MISPIKWRNDLLGRAALNEDELDRAAQIIKRGGLVAFPTETVYGLGANALDVDAVARIFAVKRRPLASPLIVHVDGEAMARTLTSDWPDRAHLLATRFWPGPLTLVLKKAEIVPDLVTAGLDSVGVRVPAHPVALELIRRAGVPIAAPSANRFTEVSPTTAAHVRESLGDSVDMILDSGPTQVGIESTVASLRRDPPVVLRPGMISQEQLEEATGVEWEQEQDVPQVMESPGQHARHYAPRTPLYLFQSRGELPTGKGMIINLPEECQAFAAKLYAALHQADKEGWDWIGVNEPPDKPEWAGIRDRLRRASKAKD